MKLLWCLLIAFAWQHAQADQSNANVSNGSSANNLKCGSAVATCNCKAPRVVKVVDQAKIVELEKEIAKLKAEKASLEAQLDNSLFYIHHQQPEKVEVVRIVQQKARNNSISVIGAASKTGLDVSSTGNSYESKTAYQGDAGLMYQHDFGRVRGSLGATLNGTGMIGIGYNF